ncbi:MAG: polymer-forming cytoskeletal protein [Betaproteobacteria bacterium]|jgi:cytoskeletal protein CcmA (bactofilin family)|nr:polymer-forming cytoskeletal protein [Betaproteobacteria bacterium]
MFGEKKDHNPQKRIDSLIGVGTTIEGNISFSGGLRIDGRVKGNVTADGEAASTLVVSEAARIDGEIQVSHVVVNGAVNGPIRAQEYLELQSKARVTGDVSYRRMEIQLGATVQGRLAPLDAAETASVVELKRGAGN